MPRDYRAEYARRIAREQERASREGRPFSRQRARGHTANEAQQARINRLIRQSTAEGSYRGEEPEAARKHLRNAVRQVKMNGMSDDEIERFLQDKRSAYRAYRGGDSGNGKGRWWGEFQRKQWVPVEFWYYHGQ